MYSQNKVVLQLIALLKAHNISKIVVSPGSRHYPITHSIENDNNFKLYSIVDERSAAFFALGLIQKYNEPVAVCCSSGSAMLNYASAVSEAYYQHLPLLLLTADRFPHYLNQKEDQMLQQDNVYRSFIKSTVNLPDIKKNIDKWFVNRLINEALVELNHHGKGPVQINIPIESHHTDQFNISELPAVRKINLNKYYLEEEKWLSFSRKLVEKKIVIVWGQSVELNTRLYNAINRFCEIYNCAILTDYISNCSHKNAINNTFSLLRALTLTESKDLAPDIVITVGGNIIFNGEIKRYLENNCTNLENWQVGEESDISDPFKCLTQMFEMEESLFFEKISSYETESINNYFNDWNRLSMMIKEPRVDYSQLYSIGELIKSLPKNSILHLANSNSIRMAHLFKIDSSIKCFCNRGVNGIDGCMSSAVGYSADSEDLVFLIIGDLTFFYDMNALWNRHLSPKLRILLTNNDGGAVMHMAVSEEQGKTLPNYTSAGHHTTAKGWVESLGIKYISAKNEDEVKNGIQILTDSSIDGPVLLEVFTKKEDDVKIFKDYFKGLNRITLTERVKRKTQTIVSKYIK